MSTYREIVGKKIKKVSSDPSDGLDGQMWYNSTTGTLRGLGITEAWVSGPAMTEPRSTMAGGGTNTSAITSGENGANPSDAVLAESYNGTGWTNETNVPTALGYANGTGASSEAYVQAGGGYPSKTGTVLDYDGSSWTSGTAVPGGAPGYIEAGMCGPSADALFCGGNNGLPNTWERGSGSWTAGSAMASGAYAPTLVGTQTAAISMGGLTYPGGYRDFNQSYNGTAWTSLTVLPAVRGYSGGAGIETLSMVIGGNSPSTAVNTCLEWDSSSWTSIPNLGTARNTMCPMGKTVGTAVAAPGNQAPAGTEEFNRSTNTITAAAWASAPSTNTALGTTAGCGSVTAGLVFSGADALTNSEKYDGTSWTATPALNVGRYGAGEATNAPQTAALCFGGYSDPPATNRDATEEWNGSSWSAQTALPVAMRQVAGCGTQTAAVSIGGYSTTFVPESYEYNGSSWTASGNVNTDRERSAGCGLETAGLAMGGNNPSPYIANVEEYDGSSWTNATALPTANKLGSAAGIQTDAIFFAGNVPPNSVVGTTLGYDGTNWSTRPSMGTGRQAGAGAGTSTAALMMAGANVSGTALTTVEEFTGETSTANIETFTTS